MQSLLFIKDPNIVGRAVMLGDDNNLMKIRPQKIQSLKTSIAAMIVASLGFFSSTAEAVILVTDDSNNPYEDTAYDPLNTDTHAFYEIIDIKEKKDVFLSTQATGSGGTTTITGYNDSTSDYAKDFTSLTLEDAGSLVYEGQTSVAFYLDINQTGAGSEQPYYEIHALEIYTSSAASFSYDNGAATGTDVTEVYKFDGAAGGNLRLQPENTTGTSNWDVALYVPLVNFERDDNLTAAETYIHFVIKYDDNSGADTWSVSTGSPLVPEPSSVLLISLGGLMGLLRRRR